jgi:hypothetical protein
MSMGIKQKKADHKCDGVFESISDSSCYDLAHGCQSFVIYPLAGLIVPYKV